MLGVIGMVISGWSQQVDRQSYTTKKIETAPVIDGFLDDEIWKDSEEKVTVFTQLAPNNGEPDKKETGIFIVYDDEAIYVALKLYDDHPEDIPRELSVRDDIDKNADHVGIVFDTYNKGQNAMGFYVTSSGVQGDFMFQRDDIDDNWNAVWQSEARITDFGWVAEMKIPYSAIRFPNEDEQVWGMNIVRNDKRNQIYSTWNYINIEKDGLINQSGELLGIVNIKPPLRLSLMPYVSGLLKTEGGQSNTSFNGGMDIKYGINESFTLDVTLIPDFSQVRSDNKVLNLSPFEVKFSENRPFFTEGTELFGIGNLFYSRRIGQSFASADPSQVRENEEIISTPANAPLINASKVSGRTANGTGLGIFNALTSSTYAEVKDTLTGEIRKMRVDPLTNFNVLVIDQNLKNNSNIALINTNVYRGKKGRTANVSHFESTFRDPSNTYSLRTGFGYSNISERSDSTSDRSSEGGMKYFAYFSKVSGNFQFSAGHRTETDTWEINDFGYQRTANEQDYSLNFRYNLFKPFSIFNNAGVTMGSNYQRLFEPSLYQEFGLNSMLWMEFRNFWNFNLMFRANPAGARDYYEPRVSQEDFGKYYFHEGNSSFSRLSVSTDSRKSLRMNVTGFYWQRPEDNARYYGFEVNPRFRANEKFSIYGGLDLVYGKNNKGRVDYDPETSVIFFGNRNVNTITGVLTLRYNFTNKMNFDVRGRNYWSRVKYFEFFSLEDDGSLLAAEYGGMNTDGSTQKDTDYTIFNIDMTYSWQIAPGSFFNVTYKTQHEKVQNLLEENYILNLKRTIENPGLNTLSAKLIYYLDAGRWL